MARLLRSDVGMSRLTRGIFIVILSLLLAPLPARAQETNPPDGTRITSAQVSGLELSKLSPGLQEEIGKLTGSPLDRQKLKELAGRLEAEQPRYVAAVRVTADPDGSARVVFVVARMRDPEHQANINARYIVEDVDISGVAESAITPELRDDLQALDRQAARFGTGRPTGGASDGGFPTTTSSAARAAGANRARSASSFSSTRTEQSRWLRFEPLEANALYHSDQGWGSMLPLTISGRISASADLRDRRRRRSDRGVFRLRPALRNAEARHRTPGHALRVVDVRPDLARSDAGVAAGVSESRPHIATA